MEETVQCGECGQRYDSSENAFCPRCGSLSRGRDVSGAVATAGRRDPDLRRVRAAGMVLMVLGAVALGNFLYAFIVPPEPDEAMLELFASEALTANARGGDLHLRVTVDGEPAEAPVAVRAMNGTVLLEGTSTGGWYNVTLPVAFANVTVGGAAVPVNQTDGNGTDGTEGNATAREVHNVYVSSGERLEFEVDLATPQEEPEWHAASTVPYVRPVLGFLAFMALVVLLGGVAAWRLRLLGLAVTGAVLAILPGVLVLAVSPVAGLFLVAPGALALAFVLRGRRHFRRAGA